MCFSPLGAGGGGSPGGSPKGLVHNLLMQFFTLTSAGVKIRDNYGPQRTEGCFMEFEVGIHDGAYKGRLHSHIPFIGCKTLTIRQKTKNDIHGYFRARVEHLFVLLWSRRVVHDTWLGPMSTFAVFAMCTCAFPEVGGFQGGHGKVELLVGAVHALCRNTPIEQKFTGPAEGSFFLSRGTEICKDRARLLHQVLQSDTFKCIEVLRFV